MSEATNIPTEGTVFPVEPPIVDLLYFNAKLNAYVITFLPADIVSRQEKETVTIDMNSEDGRRVQLRIEQIENVIARGKIDRLYHSGDGDFGFVLSDGSQWRLCDPSSDIFKSQEIYVQLQDLGMIAQIAFRQGQLLTRAG
jgi:hypothetical protein